MVQIRSVDEAGFQLLLELFGKDEKSAAEGYELMRQALITFFTFRGGLDPNMLTDLTMDRVARLLQQGKTLTPPVRPFFYRVAQYIWKEANRNNVSLLSLEELSVHPPAPEMNGEVEVNSDRLEYCLMRLAEEDRQLLLDYYRIEDRNAGKTRERLAKKHGIKVKTLRNRAYILRTQVAECFHRLLASRKVY